MSGELLIGRFPSDEQRKINCARNAVWFARVGVYETIDVQRLQHPEAEIDSAIARAQIRETAALAELDVAEREGVFLDFTLDCARLAIHGPGSGSLDLNGNVVQVAFGQA